MKKKLFGQNIIPDCSYCENAVIENGMAAYCKKGKHIQEHKCKSYRYDPLMRAPKVSVFKTNFTADDFRIG